MDNKSNVSQTAMLIASLRALACYEDDPHIHGNDDMAELFLPEDKKIPLKKEEYRPVIKAAIAFCMLVFIFAFYHIRQHPFWPTKS